MILPAIGQQRTLDPLLISQEGTCESIGLTATFKYNSELELYYYGKNVMAVYML